MFVTHTDANGHLTYHNHHYHNDSTAANQYGQVYYDEPFDYEKDWQQHPWNVGDEDEQQHTQPAFHRQFQHRPRVPNHHHQEPPRVHHNFHH